MRQLVGLSCVLCEKSIGSILEGRFCDACGCPVHTKCAKPATEPDGRCAVCGAKVEQIQQEQQLHKADIAKAPRPGLGSLGWYGQYQLVRFIIGGIACGILGMFLLLWEVSEPSPSFWAIVRSVAISILGFGLTGVLIWRAVRS